MPFVAVDWSIDRQTRNIRYIGDDHEGTTPSYATGIEFHRELQNFADDAGYTGNDELDITDPTPSDRAFDKLIRLLNGWNIDATAAEHIYDTTLFQNNDTERWDGISAVAPAGTQVQIIQNGAVIADDWWNEDGGLNADASNGVSHQFLLKTRTAGADIDGRRFIATSRTRGTLFVEFKVNGTGEGVTVVPLPANTDLNDTTIDGTVATWNTIANVTQGYNGIDVNNNGADEFYYSEWNKDSFSINQFYERMKWLTRDGSASTLYGLNGELFRGITHEINVDNPTGAFDPFESVSWTGGTGQMLAIDSPGAPTKMWIQLLTGVAPTDNQQIVGGASAATADVFVTVLERTVSTPFIGASTGSAIIGAYGVGVESADLTSNDKVFDLTNTQINPPNFVVFTVGGLINGEDKLLVGPLGHRFAYDAEASGPFQVGETLTFASPAGTAVLAELYDNGTSGFMYIGEMLTGDLPTDNSTISGGTSSATAAVNGAVSNDINLRQLTLNGLLNGGAVTSVVVTGSIPADTPNTGTIRIERADGQYTRHPYSAWSGSTFTITSHNFSTNNAANGANTFISYLDLTAAAATASFTVVYTADRNLFIRVRDGGGTPIKTFETTGTISSSGGSTTAIRTSDA